MVMKMSNVPDFEIDMFVLNDRYGCKVNIAHPKLKPLYEQYKMNRNFAARYLLSDKERLMFEGQLIKIWRFRLKRKRIGGKKHEKTA